MTLPMHRRYPDGCYGYVIWAVGAFHLPRWLVDSPSETTNQFRVKQWSYTEYAAPGVL